MEPDHQTQSEQFSFQTFQVACVCVMWDGGRTSLPLTPHKTTERAEETMQKLSALHKTPTKVSLFSCIVFRAVSLWHKSFALLSFVLCAGAVCQESPQNPCDKLCKTFSEPFSSTQRTFTSESPARWNFRETPREQIQRAHLLKRTILHTKISTPSPPPR